MEAADLLDRKPKSCQPYRLGGQSAPGLPEYTGLAAIRAALDSDGLRAGRLREVRGLLARDRSPDANAVWSRWRTITERQGGKPALDALISELRATWSDETLDDGEASCLTPVFDAMDWLAVEGRLAPEPASTVVEDAA
jgi:hypothetical protein